MKFEPRVNRYGGSVALAETADCFVWNSVGYQDLKKFVRSLHFAGEPLADSNACIGTIEQRVESSDAVDVRSGDAGLPSYLFGDRGALATVFLEEIEDSQSLGAFLLHVLSSAMSVTSAGTNQLSSAC
jgi:hypothetical protein